MDHWTQAAKAFLENHLQKRRGSIAACGADFEEVAADVRRHLTEELSAGKMPTVTAADVRRVLQQMGELDAGMEQGDPPDEFREPISSAVRSQAGSSERRAVPAKPSRYPVTFFFAVILPAVTLGIEAVTHMCGGVFFDPIPTFWHGLVVACVPVLNFLLWQMAHRPSVSAPMWRLAGGAMAAVIAGGYAILFVPLVIPAVVAIIIYGWGLLPLAPLLSLIGTSRWLVVVRNRSVPRPVGPWLAGGALAGLLALSLINSPQWLTHYWASQAAQAPTIEEARGALRNLRVFGHEETLLAACYRNVRGVGGFRSWGWQLGGRPPDVDASRRIYFQVTGHPFNAVPPPQRKYGSARWQFIDDWEWDEGHGGTAVAGRIKGLTLQQSRLDGLASPDEGWAYVEWILEFKNTGRVDREARAQIALPPGGVVSRLTLWVNGEEREAAFAGTGKVREAYREVAVVRRRDPVLVTSAGRDRVLMQCFPVPRDGGVMKVRVGITAPWSLLSEEEVALHLPYFLERNFGVPEGVQHSVWLQSAQTLKGQHALREDVSQPGISALRGTLSDDALAGEQGVVRARRASSTKPAWTYLDKDDPREVVRQAVHRMPHAEVTRVMVVLDGAEEMTDYMPEVAEALGRVPGGLEVGVILARDGVEELFSPRPWTGTTREDLARRIRRLRGAGGQDNQAALLAGWDKAGERANGVVIWVHGPQPVAFDRLENLSQRLLWRKDQRPMLYDFSVRAGPNRLAESPEMSDLLIPVPRVQDLDEDLWRFLRELSGATERWEWQRERVSVEAIDKATAGDPASTHLARLWAKDEVDRLRRDRNTDAAIQLAGRFQLVTPVSGAVVLENQAQFDRAGLKPVDADSVPTVPEPGTFVLLGVLMGGWLAAWGWRRGRR